MKKYFYLFIIAAFVLQACTPRKTDHLDSLYTSVDNAKIHYKTYGDAETTLVFVHGFGCDMRAWDYQVNDLAKQYKLIFIDLPGFGKSDKPETDYTLDFFAKCVKQVVDEQKIEKAVLVGHSLGTPICRQFCFNYPEKVKALCDVDGVYCFYPKDTLYTEAYYAFLCNFANSFRGDDLKHNITTFTKDLVVSSTPKEVYNYALANMPETPEHVAFSTMSNLIDKKYWTREQIHVPALVLCTQNSDIPPDNYQLMQELYSNMKYNEFNDLGHFIMMENPKMFNEVLCNFVNELK